MSNVGHLRARLADPDMPWTRSHVEDLINQIETLTKQRDEGWDAFYKLRKAVGEERYPGMTGKVRALSEASSAPETEAIPARAYPGDEAAVREAGVTLPYCSCVARASDDPHKKDCPFWISVLAARKAWHDRNVTAWSCSQEAKGQARCEQWCGWPQYCTAAGTDRRTQKESGKALIALNRIRRECEAQTKGTTHYDGCAVNHPYCRILAFVGDALHDSAPKADERCTCRPGTTWTDTNCPVHRPGC